MKKTGLKKFVAAFATVSMLAACGGGDEEDSTITVGLTYIPDVQFFPFYVAVENGYFESAGVEVDIRHHGAQESLFTALATGEEDVVFVSGDEVLFARAEGMDVTSIMTLFSEYPSTLIVPQDSDIETPADLEGRSVGLPGEYGSNYFGLLAMIDAYDLENVEVESIGFTQMAALSRDDVDSVIGFVNNDAVAMESQGFDVRTIDLAPDLPLIGPGLAVMEENLGENEDEHRAIMAGLQKAVEFAEENPEEALDIVTKYVPSMTDPEVREAATLTFNATLPLYVGDGKVGTQDVERWEDMSEFMVDAGLIEELVPVDEVMTTEITG